MFASNVEELGFELRSVKQKDYFNVCVASRLNTQHFVVRGKSG